MIGIAKLAAQSKEGEAVASQTSTGMMVGTPLYMSPEQCKGSGNITDKADVYSLGVMMYRMLTGRPPFLADGSGAIMAMHIYEKPTPIRELDPSIPEELAGLVSALLAKDAAERPPMAQVVQALEQLRSLYSSAVGIGAIGNVSSVFMAPTTPVPGGLTGIGQSQLIAQSQVGLIGQSQVGAIAQSQIVAAAQSSSQPGVSNSASTTLGQSAAQLGPAPKKRAALVAGLLVFGAAVAAVSFVGVRSVRKSDAAVAPTRMVHFSIQSEPAGARVVRAADHREIGKTPWTSTQPAGTGQLILVLKLDGYAEKVVTVDQAESVRIAESLKPLATSGTSSQPVSTPTVTAPVADAAPIKGRGKKGKGKSAPAAAESPKPTMAQTVAATPNPAPTPTPKPPQPSKDEPSHGRIQMVD